MAAVAASLVAFAAGLGLPELGLGNGRFSGAVDEPFEPGEGDSKQVPPCGSEAAADGKRRGHGLWNSQVEGPCYRGKRCQGSLQQLGEDLSVPTCAKGQRPADAASGVAITHTVGASACNEDDQSHTFEVASKVRVHFDLSTNTMHEITPYSEVYGLHPRDFHFGRDGERLRTERRSAVDSDEEDDKDDQSDLYDLVDRTRRRVARCSAPWHVWGVLCSLVLMVSVLGPEALPELLADAVSHAGKPPGVAAAVGGRIARLW